MSPRGRPSFLSCLLQPAGVCVFYRAVPFRREPRAPRTHTRDLMAGRGRCEGSSVARHAYIFCILGHGVAHTKPPTPHREECIDVNDEVLAAKTDEECGAVHGSRPPGETDLI